MAELAIETLPYRYAAVRVAVSRFGDALHRLSENDRQTAETIARNQYDIQSRVLSSPQAANVTVQKSQVQREITTIISRYSNEEDFERELELNELDMDSFRASVDRDLRVDAVIERVAAAAPACSETDARIYYYLHPNKFFQPETREGRHILVTINPEFPENTREEAFGRARSVARRLQKKPSRFGEQALKYSECPTAMNEGRLGRLEQGTLFDSLDKHLFSMKQGTVSDVLESPVGFHILYCEVIHPAGDVPLSQALPQIIEKLSQRNRENHIKQWLQGLS